MSAPVRLVVGATAFRLPRWRVAQLLELPAGGATRLQIGGDAAEAWFRKLTKTVETKPVDATFAVDGDSVRVVPSKPGVGLDVPASASRILAAATAAAGPREAQLATAVTRPERTTAEARAMGITGVVGSYETIYGGDSNRRHNVQLVAHLVDEHLIEPGQEFSFNRTTGERTAAKGFLEAPVIINGELQTGLGGGVCQVSTTVFNAAFEAGLSITSRTNHALYISHYPLGRDATVDYPSVDLKFVNDTDHWLLLRTFVGESSLVVRLYGTPVHRRVEVETAPLRVVSPPPLEKVKDPELPKGEKELEDAGVPAQSTSVRRRVFSPAGKLLYDSTWYSSYRAEPKIVRIGTKKPDPVETATTTTSTTKRRRRRRRLRSRNRLRQPRRHPGRPEGSRVDDAVGGPAVRDQLAVPLDRVLEAEARPPQVDAARAHDQLVVEHRGLQVAHVALEHERLDPVRADRGIAAREAVEVVDAGDLEPDEVGGVVRDPLRVGLGEADADRGCHSEAVHDDAMLLAGLIREAQPCVALTGAGVSTESGIPDFRSPTGIWRRFDPFTYASIDAWRREPEKVWEFYALRFEMLTTAEPNDAHRALAALEAAGLVRAVVTQNIDTLHQRAGSGDVVEVHGSIRSSSCLACGRSEPLERVLELLPLPACADCGAVLKPDVVMFGELLPGDRIERATALAREAGLLLVVGSSLEVWPVAGLPAETLGAGGLLAIVNRGSTDYDARAAVVVDGGAGEVLSAVAEELL